MTYWIILGAILALVYPSMMNQTSTRSYKYFDLVMALFVTVLIVSNIASSAKIVDWGVAILNLPLAFDAGTILFPVSYIFGDVLTEVYGFRRSRRVIWTGFGCLALTAVVLWLVRIMPGEATWLEQTGQPAYDAILNGLTSGGIVLASLVAYLVGEFMNSVVLAKMKAHHRQHTCGRRGRFRGLRRDRLPDRGFPLEPFLDARGHQLPL